MSCWSAVDSFFFFNDTATTEIYTLSLHDALPILNASPGAANAILVTGFSDPGTHLPGLEFTGAFSVVCPPCPSTLDLVLRYTVSTSGDPINDIHLSFNGSRTGSGFTTVTATVKNTGGTTIGQASVTNPPQNC